MNNEISTKIKEEVYIIYHANCMDGFASAVIAKDALENKGVKDIEFLAAQYGKPLENLIEKIKDKIVFILDFSYSFPIMVEIAQNCRQLIVLDHHKTAAETLENLQEIIENNKSYISFDMNRSGAGMTWDYFHRYELRPEIIQAIENRDLWKENLPNWPKIRTINSALFSFPYDFNGELASFIMSNDEEHCRQLVDQGEAIDRKHLKDCNELCVNVQFTRWYLQNTTYKKIPLLNAPYMYFSDCGNILSKNKKFAACYMIKNENEIIFSLRSDKEHGADVSAIAKSFGGGGHKNAASFSLPKEKAIQFILIGAFILS